MGDQDRRDVGLAAEQVIKVLGIGGLAPGQRVAGDIGAEGTREIGEAIAECADGHRQHPLAGRDEVGDGALQPASPARGKDQHVVLGLKSPPQTGFKLRQQGFELGAAVVDHGGGHRPLHAVRDRGRAGNSQLGRMNHAP